MLEIKVPILPESVKDGVIANWYKKAGDTVANGEHLVDIETDKVVLEVVAPSAGVLQDIRKLVGEKVSAEEIIAQLLPQEAKVTPVTAPVAASVVVDSDLAPSVRRAVDELKVDVSKIQGTGKGGRITKEDVINAMPIENKVPNLVTAVIEPLKTQNANRLDRKVAMSRLRLRIAERLLQAQQQAAILTTFNEINMQPLMELRQKYKNLFEEKNNIKLGFMSLFTKAVVEALKKYPIINASIDGENIVYHDYYDIGIAVSSNRGLVVPIIKDAQALNIADIERKIAEFSTKASSGTLSLEELTGGTFTISNGGVFGSLMSTPILNPPQSAILGMHKIEERPIVIGKEVVVRPMMYVALSYDHRLIDGADSVKFLVAVKELLEDPNRLLLGV